MSGVKMISQEMFDEVVLENVNDFDKPLEEAIQDTMQEFEAQGVKLSNIIKDVALNEAKDKVVHPVLESMEIIRKATSDEGEGDIPDCASKGHLLLPLATFTSECKISLSHRVLAGKHGAYSYLIRLLKQAKDDAELLCGAVKAMQALCDGNPDVLDDTGVKIMVELLQQWQSDTQSDVTEMLVRWCQSCNLKHENNRQSLFEAEVPHLIVSSLRCCEARQHATRMTVTLKALRSFTLDDDIRVEIGKAHDHCRHLVEEEGVIAVALDVIKGAVETTVGSLAGEALATLTCVCVRAEYCLQAADSGALEVINSLLVNFSDSAVINKQSIALVATLAGNDSVKVQVMKSGTPSLIVKAMDHHQLHAGVCSAGCSAVSMLALRNPKHATELVEVGAAAAVVQAMKQHTKEKQVQKMGCLALRNLCSRSASNSELLRQMQADVVVQAAVESHGAVVQDLAKSALRDMGVEVTLEERWHGKGHEIEMGD